MGFSLQPEDLVKILLALLIGGVVGIEREFRDKAAGFRTLIFICLGSTLFTILSLRLPGVNDNSRLAAGIVTGIGFLGAGVIMRQGFHITGLTTAATIWLTAALGVAIGAGEFALSLISAGFALVVLEVFPWLEDWISRLRVERKYEIVCMLRHPKSDEMLAIFRDCGLRASLSRLYKEGNHMICIFEASGAARNHTRLLESLLEDPEIQELRY